MSISGLTTISSYLLSAQYFLFLPDTSVIEYAISQNIEILSMKEYWDDIKNSDIYSIEFIPKKEKVTPILSKVIQKILK